RQHNKSAIFTQQGALSGLKAWSVDNFSLSPVTEDMVGHFVMDRALANRGQFPAIHVLKSISRVMNQIASPEHKESAQTFRSWLATYIDAEDLINIGAYKKGTNPAIDTAVDKYPYLLTFLKQSIEEDAAFEQTMTHLSHIARGES
ncbi:MAG: flagellum-specific ATP synthase FliI, partial [Exiguobacterium sp.]